MKKAFLSLLIFFFASYCSAQQLRVQDLRACLYPTFSIQNAVLKDRGFLWIDTKGSVSPQGESIATTTWKSKASTPDLAEMVTVIVTKLKGHVTNLVMIKYTVPDSVYAINFRNRMIDEGYHCIDKAFNGDSNVQSWLCNSTQILLRVNSENSYTFISY
jgi:hypothetical protein